MKRDALDDHIAAQVYSAGKTKNIISKLIADRNECFQIRVIENTFVAWKNFTQDKRRVMQRVATLMAKSFRQVGFDAVREADWTLRSESRTEYIVTKVFHLYKHRELLQAFHNWKTSCCAHVTAVTRSVETDLYHKIRNAEFARQATREKIVGSMRAVYAGKLMKKAFIAVFDHRCDKQYKRKAISEYRDKLVCL
jgi:hypothetical protein